MSFRDSSDFDGRAWLKGAEVAGAKLRYNTYVRVTGGENVGDAGWVVGIYYEAQPEPVYTVQLIDGHPNAEIAESLLEPEA